MASPTTFAKTTADAAARKLLQARLKAAVKAVGRLSADESDLEALHDFRTSLRRLRSLEKAFRPFFERRIRRPLRRRLAELAETTNDARDAEVLIERLGTHVEALTPPGRSFAAALLKEWEAVKVREYRRIRREVLRSFGATAEELGEHLAESRPRRRSPAAPPPPAFFAAAAEAARSLADIMRDHAERVASVADVESAHEARIAAKRLRYVLEPCAAERPGVTRALDYAEAVQETLGDLRDWQLLEAAARGVKPTGRGSAARKKGQIEVAELAAKQADDAFAVFLRQRTASHFSTADIQAALIGRTDSAVAVDGAAETEIERKYLLRAAPPAALATAAKSIAQGWLPGTRLRERLRRTRSADGAERFYRTVKLGTGIARIELEEETTPELFRLLWRATKGRRVRKNRHVVPHGELAWEIDVFLDRELFLAEIELPTVDTAVEFPDWLRPFIVREVTDDPAYLNSNLAR